MYLSRIFLHCVFLGWTANAGKQTGTEDKREEDDSRVKLPLRYLARCIRYFEW